MYMTEYQAIIENNQVQESEQENILFDNESHGSQNNRDLSELDTQPQRESDIKMFETNQEILRKIHKL